MNDTYFNIGEAAKASGVTAKMVRHYEAIGLLPPARRTEAGYRLYGDDDVRMLQFIHRGRALGFSLDQIADLLALWRDKHRASADVRRLALEHIASLTEQAANKVLNTVDTCMPEQEDLGKDAKNMEDRWAGLFAGKLSIEEFKKLAGDSKEFAGRVLASTDAEKARLLDIMMAQDFQDITGQLIKKIVTITNQVERELAQLLKDNAPPEVKAQLAAEASKPVELMQGPSAPGTALAQDDVDSLLADLGF